eukprot:TRINITY_DN6380_c0_g1_i1.p1 TRINITY_DN6380_c0_g1~~TRINITY_DN6380_c0_g1_i1.p1  ORF type:complete len:249 (-),score=60.95 TRINITY_DN6380_c0_g1_i1:128-874(-)
MVDFGWPSGFTIMACYFYLISEGFWLRKALITLLYVIAGARFMFGWFFARRHWTHEDRRWELWRERWRNGQGWFGFRSVPLNFFFFYHAQSLTNSFVMSLPLFLSGNNKTPYILPVEWLALFLWAVSFLLENVADAQLSAFKVKQAKKRKEGGDGMGVCKEGLWKYSRHPNYFFEFCIWCCYCIFSLPSLTEPWHYVILVTQPLVAYYFLVHFTGAWMAEQGSLKRRGEEYKRYIQTTNMIIPGFPRE